MSLFITPDWDNQRVIYVPLDYPVKHKLVNSLTHFAQARQVPENHNLFDFAQSEWDYERVKKFLLEDDIQL